ncbi:MAG: pyridoxal-phosphate-dependent aminotransferase family protein [Acetobacteraceae bacterium]
MKQPPRGRNFFFGPGPTNIPDSVLAAIAHATVDFNDADFLELYEGCVAGLKRLLGTSQHVFLYTASGHGAWEATFANLCTPGDRILMVESGYFSEDWTKMARKFGLVVETLSADWRRGADFGGLRRMLAADSKSRNPYRALCIVHNETSTGVRLPLEEAHPLLEETGHPALLFADTISSFGSMACAMEAWGIDALVGGSQKGLMLPTGMSFTAVSEKAMAVHAKTAGMARCYFDWTEMLGRRQKSFSGTLPVALFFGLRESLRRIEEEGLTAVFARHHRLGEGVRRAVRHWSGNAGPELYCTDPARVSDSVTAIRMPDGQDAEAIRETTRRRFNVALGCGLGTLRGKVVRIGHLGDLNEPMVLGALGAVEMSLGINAVPHNPGGVDAAMAWFAEGERPAAERPPETRSTEARPTEARSTGVRSTGAEVA